SCTCAAVAFWLMDQLLLGCFFFQAEDGIRDSSVTGVQTCALPISPASRLAAAFADADPKPKFLPAADLKAPPPPAGKDLFGVAQIGRASCRERVWGWVVAGVANSEVREDEERECRVALLDGVSTVE